MLIRRRGEALCAVIVASLLVAPATVRAQEEEEEEAAAPAPAALPPADADPDAAQAEPADADGVGSTTAKKKNKKKGGSKKARRAAEHDGFSTPWRVGASAGMLDGSGTLVARAATTGVSAEVTPTWQRGALEVAVPIRIDDREAFGENLSARDARAGVEATYRRSKALRLSGTLDVRGASRPDWPDQYQPLAGGGLAGTDRFGHLDLSAGGAVTAIPVKHWHARGAVEVASLDYVQDPAYSLARPTHLVPRDRMELSAKGAARYFGDGWKAGGGLDVGYRAYASKFSRDAGTGLTHAGAGGPPPNPLYSDLAIEPRVDADIDLAGGDAELDVSYGYEIVSDRYAGYYSFGGHHPEAKLKWRRGELELAAKADLKWRTYGADSYAVGGNHPALEYGDRRVDRRFRTGLDARYALTSHWAVLGEADAMVRRTNFPTYSPGVFPASQQYDIDWSYQNFLVQAGVEYHP